jgi:ParB/RepB/Spo0J family partition protein
MQKKPNLDEFLAPGTSQPQPIAAADNGGQQLMAPTGQLRPSAKQDRDDMDSEASAEHIRALAESIKLKLPNGRQYGIRRPIEVRPVDSAGLYEIIAGENRWRAAQLAGLEMVPITIKDGDEIEARLDHVTDNALRRDLNLWQQACSIQRDQEEFKMSTEQVIVAHGLRNKTQLSKLMAVFKLPEEAQSFVKKGLCQDVNLVYDLRKLQPEQLSKLATRVMSKGESFPAALKAVLPKEPKPAKEPKATPAQGGAENPESNTTEQGGGAPGTGLTISVGLDAALALAVLLDIDAPEDIDPAELTQLLQDKIGGLVGGSE